MSKFVSGKCACIGSICILVNLRREYGWRTSVAGIGLRFLSHQSTLSTRIVTNIRDAPLTNIHPNRETIRIPNSYTLYSELLLEGIQNRVQETMHHSFVELLVNGLYTVSQRNMLDESMALSQHVLEMIHNSFLLNGN